MYYILACLAFIAATPATALSCLRPDAVRLFEQARDAEEAFFIVKGRVSLLEPPNLPVENTETPAQTHAQIEGLALTPTGFNQPFDHDVIIETICLGPWCASLEGLDDDLIMAVKTEDDRLTLRIGPCGGDQILWDEDGENRILSCYRDGICEQNY